MPLTKIIDGAIDLAESGHENGRTVDRAVWTDYLKSLSDDEVIWLETLMYFGRDTEDMHQNDVSGYRGVIGHSRSDASLHITDIAVSGHLSTYLNDALAKCSALSIEVDSLI